MSAWLVRRDEWIDHVTRYLANDALQRVHVTWTRERRQAKEYRRERTARINARRWDHCYVERAYT